MRWLFSFYIIVTMLMLSSCYKHSELNQGYTNEVQSIVSVQNPTDTDIVELEVLKNILLEANKDFQTFFIGKPAGNVIGVFEDEDLTVIEHFGEHGSFSEAILKFDSYTPEMLRLEIRRHGFEVVDDKIGIIPAAGESRYLIQDGTTTNRVSTMAMVWQDDSKAIVNVECFSDTDKNPKVYEYIFDITNKDHPILIDVSGYGIQHLKDSKAIPLAARDVTTNGDVH